MTDLEELAPKRKELVIDLVRQAGIDVSDWANSKRGPAGASVNPKYCYEWAFESDKVAVLNLWHDEMRRDGEAIVRLGNFRTDAEFYRGQRGRSAWVRRAIAMDRAVQLAASLRLPIRVIVNAGVRRVRGDPNAVASKVMLRDLDDMPWHVGEYDIRTGAHVLVRGPQSPAFVDQHSIRQDASADVRTRGRTGSEYVRDRVVRNAVLARANGKCEHCGAQGFRMPSGSIYIETHHILPLSEGGADDTRNVIGLCPNHHREAHHGQARAELSLQFRAIAAAG